MSGGLRCGMGAALLAGVLGGPAMPAGGAPPPGPSPAHRVESVTLEIYHRVFHDFRERQRVGLGREFRIGDTDYSARIVRYVPDFAMDTRTRTVVSRTPEPHNPAFRIVVRRGGEPQDTTWALLKMPPHFAMRSMLAFKILRIDFAGRPPLLNPESAAKPDSAAHADSLEAKTP